MLDLNKIKNWLRYSMKPQIWCKRIIVCFYLILIFRSPQDFLSVFLRYRCLIKQIAVLLFLVVMVWKFFKKSNMTMIRCWYFSCLSRNYMHFIHMQESLPYIKVGTNVLLCTTRLAAIDIFTIGVLTIIPKIL